MKGNAEKGLIFNEPLIFEQGKAGRIGIDLPKTKILDTKADTLIGASLLRESLEGMPEHSEPEVMRHFTRLSQWNFGVDSGFYPLGSCTMKYNPKVNELAAGIEGFSGLHPLQSEESVQSALQVIYELEEMLCEITGMDSASLQQSAGAQGELCGVMVIRSLLESRGDGRKKIILPDSAHGTNPSSASLCDYQPITLPSGPDGLVDLKLLEETMDEDVAAIMLTNPNTLGIFEKDIKKICQIVHAKGGLVYSDGANLNALLGKTRFGDMGIDVCHLNLHKTFSTPHGGGGPGSGPCLVKKELARFLPVPKVKKDGGNYRLDWAKGNSVGSFHAFYGNFSVLLRAYSYILTMGAEGLRDISETAVLNANYIKEKLKDYFDIPYKGNCMHECVLSDRLQSEHHVSTLDIAKGLIDRGFHPPTIYFPLIVHGAMMIEPTESESMETIDSFIEAMIEIAETAKNDPDSLHNAPINAKRKRLDETKAARHPDLRYRVSQDSTQ